MTEMLKMAEDETGGGGGDVHDQFSNIQQKRRDGHVIARKRQELLNAETWSLEQLWYASQFFGDYKAHEAGPENDRIAQMTDLVDLMERERLEENKDILDRFLSKPSVLATLKRNFLFGFSKRLWEMDPITRDAVLSWDKPDVMPYEYYSNAFFSQWAGEGSTCLVIGKKGSGKTDISVRLLFQMVEYRQALRTQNKDKDKDIPLFVPSMNVRLADPQYAKYYYASYGEMYLQSLNNAIEGNRTIRIFDEPVAAGLRKKNAITKNQKSYEEMDTLSRKLQVDVIKIYQYDEDIPPIDYKTAALIIRRPGSSDPNQRYLRKQATFVFKNGYSQKEYHMINVLPSPVKFDTGWPAAFKHDIQHKDIMDKMSDIEPNVGTTKELFIELRDWLAGKLGIHYVA
jgi:energy-coupling factor transporter ATP-binding protein EcfA2